MLCPNPSCAALTPHPTLTLSERQGIEIDYCPTCRGVWLDRGELDKLIERATADTQAAPLSQPVVSDPRPRHDDYRERYPDHYKHSHKDHYKGYYGHRKKSLLGELFDF